MPRIRKRTSKRGTTHQREKIKRKVSETRRKAKKAGKKDVTWKTKNPKDPGIPNNFPYKDQILAEIEKNRREAEEAKQKQKDARKAAKVAASTEQDEAEGSESGFDAVNTLKASATTAKAKKTVAQTVDDDDDVPVLINRDLPNLKSVLDKADVVLEVLDVRDPLPFRSERLETLVKEGSSEKRIIMVLNKIDTVPRESVSSWAKHVRADHPTFLLRSASAFLPSNPSLAASSGKTKPPVDDGVGADALLEHLGRLASDRSGDEPLVVAVVGLANAGKSAMINTLAKSAAFPVYKLPSLSAPPQGPTTTTYAQELTPSAGEKKIRFIDTPGLAWESGSADSEERRITDILLRSRGRIDKLKDPEPAVEYIVKHAEHEDLMLSYNLPAFIRGDTKGFLAGVARVNGLVKKAGVIDHATAARTVLRDWSTGKFARYTNPPSSHAEQEQHVDDFKHVLDTLKTRKELVKSVSLVKMIPGAMEDRMPVLEENWIGEEGEEEDEEDEEAEEDELVEEDEEVDSDVEELSGGDEDEDDDEEIPAPAPGKRKRTEKASTRKAPPTKKISFAPLPKESKQARRAVSAPTTQKSPGKPKPAPRKKR
ncbi:hypothetical protein OE88DRAFT_1652921 [Heliocybe sulcata]|uniref:P-loop containing nucleoside triphosphate hydrolase protein n=1 Tax=Heliocybe sulcata TaxID=5364 RepID=A0A5C3NH90_9AGAM|nr:hypothetical protein OE88DRAFT_1652921 [Heliocybe sulcata]